MIEFSKYITPPAKHKLNEILFCSLAFSIAFPQKISTVAIIAWGVVHLFLFFVTSTYKNNFKDYHNWGLCLFLILQIWGLTNDFFHPSSAKSVNTLFGTKAPLVIFPVLFLIYTPDISVRKILKWYVLGTFTFVIITMFWIAGQIIISPHLFYYRDFLGQFGNDLCLFQNRIYLSLNILIAVLILLYDIIENRSRNWATFILVAFMVLILFILGSRISVISLFLVMLFWFIRGTSNRKILLLFIFLGTLGLLLFGNERIFISFNFQSLLNNEPRIIIWKSSSELLANMPFWGYGSQSIKELLYQKYVLINFLDGINNRYDTHNYFLDTLLSHGWFGLFMLLCFIIYLFILGSKNKTLFYPIILVFIIQMLFENLLNRNAGALSFMFLISTIYLSKEKLSATLFPRTWTIRFNAVIIISFLILYSSFYFLFKSADSYENKDNTYFSDKHKAYLFDNHIKPFYWGEGNYFYYPQYYVKISKNDSIEYTVRCYVSENYNGEFVKLWIENSKGEYVAARDYDLSKKGTWQTLQMRMNNTESNLFFLYYIYNKTPDKKSTFDGYVLFEKPSINISEPDHLSLSN